MMAEIYSNATQVITYMGPEERGDSEALILLTKMDNHFSPFYDSPELSDYNYAKYVMEKPPIHLKFKISKNDPTLKSLYSILFGEWTKRLWMVQENVLNKDTVMLRGHKLIPALAIQGVLMLSYSGLIPNLFLQEYHAMSQMAVGVLRAILHYERHAASDYSLANLSRLLGPQKCNDPRDRIFSLLAIAKDSKSLKIVPDYTKSVRDVFIDVAIRLVRANRIDDLLVIWAPLGIRNSYLPSWVPSFDTLENRVANNLFGAVATRLSNDYKLEADSVLVLNGIHLATISDPLGTFGYDIEDIIVSTSVSFRTKSSENFLSILEKARERAKDKPNVDATIYHTLMGGLDVGKHYSGNEVKTAAQGLHEVIAMLRSQTSKRIKLMRKAKISTRKAVEIFGKGHFSQSQTLANELVYNTMIKARSLCVTNDGRLCLTPEDARSGDIVAVLLGGSSLYVLRPDGNGKYIYIGDAFIYGEMRGESLKGEEWREKLQDFRLV
jgi:hypothetical protein